MNEARLPQTSDSIPLCLSHITALQFLAYCRYCGYSLVSTRKKCFPPSILHPGTPALCSLGFARSVQLPTSLLNTNFYQNTDVNTAQSWASVPHHFVTSDSSMYHLDETRIMHHYTKSLHGKVILKCGNLNCTNAPLALIQCATTLTEIELLTLAFEICGTYQAQLIPCIASYNTTPLTSVQEISRCLTNNPSVHGAKLSRKILPYIRDNSASPRETATALLLGLPRKYGGYGLGVPHMNYSIECTPKATAICNKRALRCDLFWPQANVALEYQSRQFHAADADRIHDSRRANALRSMGITVLEITNEELATPSNTDVIADTIAKALGKRFKYKIANWEKSKLMLRTRLGLPTYRRYY